MYSQRDNERRDDDIIELLKKKDEKILALTINY
jgi:hypothetical protein